MLTYEAGDQRDPPVAAVCGDGRIDPRGEGARTTPHHRKQVCVRAGVLARLLARIPPPQAGIKILPRQH